MSVDVTNPIRAPSVVAGQERGCDHPDVACPDDSRCINGECVTLEEIKHRNQMLGAGILLILGWSYYSGT